MKNTWVRFKLLYIILFLLLILQFLLPKWNTALKIYSESIYPTLLKLANISRAKSILPWGDILYLLFIFISIFFLYATFIAFKRKKLKVWFINSFSIALSIYLLFLFLWGINYHIPKLESIKEPTTKLTTVEILNLHHFFIENMDEKQLKKINDVDFSSILLDATNIQKSYSELNINWSLKESMFSFWIDRSGTSGYYNPFTFESYVNKNLPKTILPFICLHELAHQAGHAKEGEANFFAYLIAKESNKIHFKNAAYFQGFIYTSAYLKKSIPEIHKTIIKDIPETISEAYLEYLSYVQKHQNSPLKRTTKVFDTFLKIQGEKEGIKSYSLFLDWIYPIEKKSWEEIPPY